MSLSSDQTPFPPGTLLSLIRETSDRALQCGALQPIATDYTWIEQNDVVFLVRIVANLVRKDAAKRQQDRQEQDTGKEFNPFLPYDENLFVTDLSETHLCLLNKFKVIDDHILIITRDFEPQESLLNPSDFTALWTVLQEIDGLAFYNSGKIAGASQRHKHLQVVPLPLVPDAEALPIATVIEKSDLQSGTIAALPFAHGIASLPNHLAELAPEQAGQITDTIYQSLLNQLHIILSSPLDTSKSMADPGASGQSPAIAPPTLSPYNLLMTRQWMMLVPRAKESCDSISVNALGFAGALLVRDEHQMQWLKNYGPMAILTHVAAPILVESNDHTDEACESITEIS